MTINVKKLYEDAIIPTRGTIESAGYDLYAYLDDEKIVIKPMQTIFVKTGIAMEIPVGYYGALHTRSGIGTKRNLRLANCTGIIDSDYRGELLVAVYNDSDQDQILTNKERFAQIVIMPYLKYDICEVDELNSPSENHDGFGSTGNK